MALYARSFSIAALMLLGSLATVPLSGCRLDSATAGDPSADTPRPGTRAQGPRKRALIVAISKYEPSTLWSKINSTNDIPLVQAALRAQGFQEIHVLPEKDATAKGIEDAFKKYLISPSVEGDIAVFHFSGHGQQITDDDGDEVDGYDETLVPYDAPMNPGPGYDGSKHLRDDVLKDLVQRLRDKVKSDNPKRHGNVVILLDSCFSGTGARGGVRGGADPIGPPRPGFKEVTRGQMGSGLFSRGEMAAPDTGLAPYIVFSAARANQVDKEILDPTRKVLVGPLSWAISRALLTLRGEEPTYRHLFTEVQSYMREESVPGEPQLEGDADIKIFSGQAKTQKPFFPIAEVQPGGKTVLLPMGSMGGLLPGAEVEIHKQGTLTPVVTSFLAKGKVKKANALKAIVELDRQVAAAQLRKGQAFVTRYSFGDLRMRVQVSQIGDASLQARVRAALATVPSVEIVGSEPEVIVSLADSKVRIETQTGTEVLLVPPDTADLEAQITGRMTDLARNRYLSRLKLDNPDFRFSLKIVPIRVSGCFDEERPRPGECATEEEIDTSNLISAGNQLQLPIGTFFKVKVTPGQQKAYGVLLDLMPDGRIDVFWPEAGFEQFAPRGPLDLEAYYKVTGPSGIEELLFVASKDPISFEPFVSGPEGESASRASLGPFAPLFDDVKTLARADVAFSANQATTTSVRFTVVPK